MFGIFARSLMTATRTEVRSGRVEGVDYRADLPRLGLTPRDLPRQATEAVRSRHDD